MNLAKLNGRDVNEVEKYVTDKLKSFKGVTYSKTSRRKKCDDYYVAAAGGPHGREIIERVYPAVFGGELFDSDRAKARAATALAKTPDKVMIESGAYFEKKKKRSSKLTMLHDQLARDLAGGGAWQDGEVYLAALKTKMAEIDKTICDTSQFKSEFSTECRNKISSNTALSRKEAAAELELMVDFKERAAISFEARSVNWGEIAGKLDQSFKAELWVSGSAKVNMSKAGISAEMQAAIAVGMTLNVEGELKWTKGDAGVELGGKAEAFAGARAELAAKLSVSARTGFEAAISVGAFAGLEFKCEGSCAFTYKGKKLAGVSGSASITFGAGASFEASLEAPIFGPTSISMAGNLTLGVGSASSVAIEINFNQLALASSAAFRDIVYWRIMAVGYEATLMNSDAVNLYYLKKCIKRLAQEIAEEGDAIASYSATPIDKRALLHAV